MKHRILMVIVMAIALPWLVMFAVIGYSALGSMICWGYYGDAHQGEAGSLWLLRHCG